MADTTLAQAIDDDLRLIYDVVAYLTPHAAKDPKAAALIAAIHDKQAELLHLQSKLNEEP